jgi:hypothetical protein
MARFFCSMAFANATGITALHICGRPTYKTRLSTTKHVSLPKAGSEIVATIQAGSSLPIFLVVRHAR